MNSFDDSVSQSNCGSLRILSRISSPYRTLILTPTRAASPLPRLKLLQTGLKDDRAGVFPPSGANIISDDRNHRPANDALVALFLCLLLPSSCLFEGPDLMCFPKQPLRTHAFLWRRRWPKLGVCSWLRLNCCINLSALQCSCTSLLSPPPPFHLTPLSEPWWPAGGRAQRLGVVLKSSIWHLGEWK